MLFLQWLILSEKFREKKMLERIRLLWGWRGYVLILRDFKEMSKERCYQVITADAFYIYIYFLYDTSSLYCLQQKVEEKFQHLSGS